jgi:hypothetical protein
VFWPEEESVTVVKEMHIVKPYRPDAEEMVEVKFGGQLYAGVLKCVGTLAVVSKAEEEFISTMKQATPSCPQKEGSKQKKATDGSKSKDKKTSSGHNMKSATGERKKHSKRPASQLNASSRRQPRKQLEAFLQCSPMMLVPKLLILLRCMLMGLLTLPLAWTKLLLLLCHLLLGLLTLPWIHHHESKR